MSSGSRRMVGVGSLSTLPAPRAMLLIRSNKVPVSRGCRTGAGAGASCSAAGGGTGGAPTGVVRMSSLSSSSSSPGSSSLPRMGAWLRGCGAAGAAAAGAAATGAAGAALARAPGKVNTLVEAAELVVVAVVVRGLGQSQDTRVSQEYLADLLNYYMNLNCVTMALMIIIMD